MDLGGLWECAGQSPRWEGSHEGVRAVAQA